MFLLKLKRHLNEKKYIEWSRQHPWTLKFNEKRSAWTCWGSGVKFSHGTTTGRWRSYDRTNSLRTPTMKESQLLREKTTSSVFVSTYSNAVHAQFIDLHTQHQAMWRRLLAVETLPIDCWPAWSHHRPAKIYARSIAIEVKHETLPANRTRLLAATVATASRSTGIRHAVGAAMAIVLKISTVIIWSWPVECTTSKDRSRKRAVMAEGWGGRFGRSLLCPGRAEKETRGSWPTTGCLPINRNKLGPDSWRDEKGVWDTDTQTHTRN